MHDFKPHDWGSFAALWPWNSPMQVPHEPYSIFNLVRTKGTAILLKAQSGPPQKRGR